VKIKYKSIKEKIAHLSLILLINELKSSALFKLLEKWYTLNKKKDK
jgi:hypothetical protein